MEIRPQGLSSVLSFWTKCALLYPALFECLSNKKYQLAWHLLSCQTRLVVGADLQMIRWELREACPFHKGSIQITDAHSHGRPAFHNPHMCPLSRLVWAFACRQLLWCTESIIRYGNTVYEYCMNTVYKYCIWIHEYIVRLVLGVLTTWTLAP